MAETEFSLNRFKGDEGRAAKVYEGAEAITAEDVAEAVHWVVNLPRHVNVNTLEMMGIDQAWSPFAINRETD